MGFIYVIKPNFPKKMRNPISQHPGLETSLRVGSDWGWGDGLGVGSVGWVGSLRSVGASVRLALSIRWVGWPKTSTWRIARFAAIRLCSYM